jgi:hypothetical protein
MRSRANSSMSDPSAQSTPENFNAAIRGGEVEDAVSSNSIPIDTVAATTGDDDVPNLTLPPSEDSFSDSDTDTHAEKKVFKAKKALQKAKTALTDLNLIEDVLKAITYGSVRHQHTVTREVSDFGEKRTVKTYIEVTEVYEVPADHSVKDVAAAVEDEDSEWESEDSESDSDSDEEGSVEMLAQAIGGLPGGVATLGKDLEALIAGLKASE